MRPLLKFLPQEFLEKELSFLIKWKDTPSFVKADKFKERHSVTDKQLTEYFPYISDLVRADCVLEMQKYCQHGHTSTYEHCLAVAHYSYRFCRRLNIRADIRSIVRGALLHDLFLYDWHIPHESHRLHGFYHPEKAAANAKKYFTLSKKEEDIIATHMWPLTLRKLPRHREAAIVCLIDKACSLFETFRGRYKDSVFAAAGEDYRRSDHS